MSKNKPAKVFHFDLYGRREDKYDFLSQQSIDSVQWTELEVNEPGFFFVPKNFNEEKSYRTGFSIEKLFIENTSGIKTHDDNNLVSLNPFTDNNHT